MVGLPSFVRWQKLSTHAHTLASGSKQNLIVYQSAVQERHQMTKDRKNWKVTTAASASIFDVLNHVHIESKTKFDWPILVSLSNLNAMYILYMIVLSYMER